MGDEVIVLDEESFPHAHFHVIGGPCAGMKFIVQGRAEVKRGSLRERNCWTEPLYFKDQMLSKLHAVIECSENGIFIEDMKSTNGTLVNGTEIKTRVEIEPMKHIVEVGQNHLKLQHCDCEDLDACIICGITLLNMGLLDRQLHINNCLDSSLSEKKAMSLVKQDAACGVGECFMCGISLALYSEGERAIHINNCCEPSIPEKRKKSKVDHAAKKKDFVVPTDLAPMDLNRAKRRLEQVDSRIESLQRYRDLLQQQVDQAITMQKDGNSDSDIAVCFNSDSSSQVNVVEIESSDSSIEHFTLGKKSITVNPTNKNASVPEFDLMDDRALENLMEENGLKKGSREHMVGKLSEEWEKISPLRDCTPQEPQCTKVPEQQSTSMAICEAIKNIFQNEAMYEDILMQKCVNLNAIQKSLVDADVKVSKKNLMSFLDSHGVVYRQ